MNPQRALISVSNKEGLTDFAKQLGLLGIELVSTGGTARALRKAGLKVRDVSELTGFAEMLDGRVKTLHPLVHGGILALRDNKEHLKQVEKEGIQLIDLVIVNLYPFKETIAKNSPLEECIENIDIGGPAMIRSAAKNYKHVGVVVDPKDYGKIIKELQEKSELSLEFKQELARKAFEHTANYDATINQFFNLQFLEEDFPEQITFTFDKMQSCRYGENPHQKAAVYKEFNVKEPCIVNFEQLNGKELSFNNFNDSNAAIELLKEFNEKPACVIVKHANPCGVAVSEKLLGAFKKALSCDSKSAFGGIIALNRSCDLDTASQITSFFNEVVIAPDYKEDALDELKSKKNLRVLKIEGLGENFSPTGFDLKKIVGGLLVQDRDVRTNGKGELNFVSDKKPSDKELDSLLFAWRVAKHVKSNAIVLAKGTETIAIGAGQMSRIDSVELCERKGNGKIKGSVMASDAFFPFRDSVDKAAELGVIAIIQPGGSIKDDEVIQAANEHKIALVFTGKRHFKH